MDLPVPRDGLVDPRPHQVGERLEVEVRDREGCWHSLRVRPYKTLDNQIDGVILAFVDIDVVRRALTEARTAQAFAESVLDAVRQPMLVLDADLRVTRGNRAYYAMFGGRPLMRVGSSTGV